MRVSAIVAILLSLLPLAVRGGDDVRRVSAVEFRGLKLLTKYDIIRGVRLKAVDGGIEIDIHSLEQALSRNAYLRGFSIHESAGRLIVTVDEKKPVLVMVVARGGTSTIYEMDEGHTVISRDDPHAANLPVLCVAGRDLRSDAGKQDVRNLLSLLNRVKRKNAGVYRELSEISYREEGLRVFLRGRKTRFILRPDDAEFIKLKYIAGQCDRTKTYPDEIAISGDAAIIR